MIDISLDDDFVGFLVSLVLRILIDAVGANAHASTTNTEHVVDDVPVPVPAMARTRTRTRTKTTAARCRRRIRIIFSAIVVVLFIFVSFSVVPVVHRDDGDCAVLSVLYGTIDNKLLKEDERMNQSIEYNQIKKFYIKIISLPIASLFCGELSNHARSRVTIKVRPCNTDSLMRHSSLAIRRD